MAPLFTLNIKGRLYEYDRPAVMGIINVTPDSFYAGSRVTDDDAIGRRARDLVAAGADMLDIGAYSTRPGAAEVSAEEECRRLCHGIAAVRAAVGNDVPLSVDTFRADVARKAVGEWGGDIVNDISGGTLDPEMFDAVAELRCPYVLMHTRGTPATMSTLTEYPQGVVAGVIEELSHAIYELEERGVADIIIDPGFGFAKTLEQNYELLAHLDAFEIFHRPILAGVSRKSMITRLLGISADEALTPTAILGALALERGAAILRVHDVLPAAQTVAMLSMLDAGNK